MPAKGGIPASFGPAAAMLNSLVRHAGLGRLDHAHSAAALPFRHRSNLTHVQPKPRVVHLRLIPANRFGAAIRDKALVIEIYSRQAKSTEAERQACEIWLRVERKAGQLMRQMAKAHQRHSGRGDQKSGSQAATPTLADLGISRTQSSRWQKLGAMP